MLAFLADVDPDFRFGFFPVAENVIHENFLLFFNGYYRCRAPGVKEQSRRRVLRMGVAAEPLRISSVSCFWYECVPLNDLATFFHDRLTGGGGIGNSPGYDIHRRPAYSLPFFTGHRQESGSPISLALGTKKGH